MVITFYRVSSYRYTCRYTRRYTPCTPHPCAPSPLYPRTPVPHPLRYPSIPRDSRRSSRVYLTRKFVDGDQLTTTEHRNSFPASNNSLEIMDSVKTEVDKPTRALPVQRKPKFDQLRADHEMFLKAFESESHSSQHQILSQNQRVSRLLDVVFIFFIHLPFLVIEPTQIYRFLRTRNAIQVSFLKDKHLHRQSSV